MAHDRTSSATVRELLSESDVAASDRLVDTLIELKTIGERPAPPMSSELSALMRALPNHEVDGGAADNVVVLRRGQSRRRTAAIGGTLALAMAAGISGVAALNTDSSPAEVFESALKSVVGWVAPPSDPTPVRGGVPAQPDTLPSEGPEPAAEHSVPAPTPATPLDSHPEQGPTELPVETLPRPNVPTESPGKGRSDAEPHVVPPAVSLPELPEAVPHPVPPSVSVPPADRLLPTPENTARPGLLPGLLPGDR